MYSNGGIYIPDRKPPMGALLNPYLEINRGIVCDLPFWEGAGLTVEDLSGNGNDGTLTGTAPSWTPGNFGSAVLLPATDEYINLGDKAVFDFTDGSGNDQPYSLVGWFYINDITRTQGFFSKYVSSEGWMLWSAGSVLYMQHYRTSSNKITRNLTMTAALYQAQWIQLVVTYDGSEAHTGFKIYRNDKQVDTSGSLVGTYTGLIQNAQAANIGACSNGNVLSGKVGSGIVYNRVLSASEIALLCQEPFCGFRWASIEQLYAYVAAGGIQVLRRRMEAA